MRATSGAQSPSLDGVRVLHHASRAVAVTKVSEAERTHEPNATRATTVPSSTSSTSSPRTGGGPGPAIQSARLPHAAMARARIQVITLRRSAMVRDLLLDAGLR